MSQARRYLAGAGSVVFMVIIAGLIGKLLSPDATGERGGSASAQRTAAGDGNGPTLKPGEIDLLPLIRLESHAVSGTWKQAKGGGLVTPAEPEARVEIPYVPPEEYDLRVIVLRRSSDFRSFHLGLVGGGRQFLVSLDVFGGRSILENLDGKPSVEAGSFSEGWALKERRPLTITCAVRRSHLTVSVEGRPVIDWEADFKRLSLPQHWKIEDDQALFLGVFKSRYEISEIVLTPVTGTGKALK